MNHRVAHRSAGTAPDRPTLGTATRWTRHGRPGQHDIPLSPLQPAGPARGGRDAGCPGRWTAIAGPSGVGKTTLLSSTASVRQPTTGTVRWVTETGVLLLNRSGLDPNTKIGVDGRSLSGGEQRRLHISRALATQPDVLLIGLCGEPTTGLDTSTGTHVLMAIRGSTTTRGTRAGNARVASRPRRPRLRVVHSGVGLDGSQCRWTEDR